MSTESESAQTGGDDTTEKSEADASNQIAAGQGSSEQTEPKSSDDADTEISETTIRPEFKEAVDSYEDFFDEYVAFMEKYSESDDTASMLADYSSYMTQYAETMEKMESIDEDELTTAEAAYYTKVSARILEKLATVSQ